MRTHLPAFDGANYADDVHGDGKDEAKDRVAAPAEDVHAAQDDRVEDHADHAEDAAREER